ncbi:MAG: SGNH/GDSL hydrolase family protein [Chloroflexi bacterium]|nr:SGNH/GDSL hydrolase family protein [Chloroflexota bacterium]
MTTLSGGILSVLALVACGGGTIPIETGAPTPIPPATIQKSPEATEFTRPEIKGLRFLALGDSYTIGQSVTASGRWPVQLVRMMREAEVSLLDPEIIAQTGWTTADLSAAIDQVDIEGTFGIVSLLIGVNNQFRGLEIEEYQREFAVILRSAVRLAGGDASHVIVISIPDWGVTPFAQGLDRTNIAQQIDLFNSVNKMEATRAGSRYVDVTGISRQASTQSTLVAGDGLHPSEEMYSRWVDVVLPVALEIAAAAARK